MARSLFAALRDAASAFPAPNRILQTVESLGARSERVANQYARAIIGAAEAATAAWRPNYSLDGSVVSLTGLDSMQPAAGAAAAATWRPTPPSGSVTQVSPTQATVWSYADVNRALDSHEWGQFFDSSLLGDAFGRDDRITGCLGTRVRALAGKSGVGFEVQPSKRGDPKQAAEYAAEVDELWFHVCPEAVLTHILRDAVLFGCSFCRIHWELVGGKRVPRLEPWDIRGIFFDWSIRRYRAIALEGIFTIDPFSGEWLVFEPAGPWRSWMWGAIRALGRPWLIRQFTFRDWARYSEKHGIPILAVKEPQGHQWERQKTGFWQRMRQLGVETTLRLPRDDKDYGFDVELIEAKARSEQAFKLLIERLDVNVAVTLLGQNLSTEVQGGSHAAAQAHELVRLDYLDADAQTLATCLREAVWKPYLRFNVPTAFDEEQTPWPTWQTRPAEDKAALADVVSKVFSALSAGAQVGLTLPAVWTKERLGLPIIGLPTKTAGLIPTDGGPNDNDGEGDDVLDRDGNPVGGSRMPAPVQQPGKGGDAGGKPGAPPGKPAGKDTTDADAAAADEATALAAAIVASAAALPQRNIGGIKVTIDRPAGFVQAGRSPEGATWQRTYQVDYGFIAGTSGGDGEPLDAYVGADEAAPDAYLIAQQHADGTPDEWKLMLGFSDQGAAVACYLEHTPAQFLAGVVRLPMAALRGLLGLDPGARTARLNVMRRVARRVPLR